MNIINRNWRTTYLEVTALIIIDTLIITIFLKPVLAKDNIFKTATLSLGLSLVSVLTFCDLYLLPKPKKVQVINEFTFFIMAAIHLYIIALGILSAFIELVKKCQSEDYAKQKIKTYKNQIVILFSMIFAILIPIFTVSIYDVMKIMKQNNFWSCLGISVLSIIVLYLVSRPLDKLKIAQAVKRKIFHLGPILVIPLIGHMNANVLIMMLSGAFAVLFLLEVIRYKQQELDEDHADVNIFLQKILSIFNVVYHWMAQFNKREKHFWFTHLFLCLSLLCSYQLPQLITLKMKLSPHLVLIIIAADAFAAIIGSNYGKIKIYGNKTLQGTLAFIVTCFVGSYYLIPLNMTQLSILSIVCGIAQLLGGDADNMVTLLTYYGVRFIFVLVMKLKLI